MGIFVLAIAFFAGVAGIWYIALKLAKIADTLDRMSVTLQRIKTP